jgi:membrane protein required for colicin V production
VVLDIISAIILIGALFKGYTKGFIIALFSFVALLIGLTAATKLSAVVASKIGHGTGITASWLPFVSFLLIMIAVTLIVRLVAGMFQKAAELVLLGWANKLAGILLFGAIYLTIWSVVLFYGDKLHLITDATKSASKTYSCIAPWGPKVLDSIGEVIPFFKDMFTSLGAHFETLGKQVQ